MHSSWWVKIRLSRCPERVPGAINQIPSHLRRMMQRPRLTAKRRHMEFKDGSLAIDMPHPFVSMVGTVSSLLLVEVRRASPSEEAGSK